MLNAHESVTFSNGEKSGEEGNFIMQELAERAEIREKSKLFKDTIDKQKEKRLYEMELEHKYSMECADNIEKALDENDPELLKEMLRNIKI